MESLPIEAKRLKSLRDDLGLSQTEFAEKVGLRTTADLERGKTRITGYIVKELLKQFQINPLWLYGESKKKHLQTDVLPKMISVNETGSENIVLVNEKAAAGYGQNIGDPEYYGQLPAFSFPLFEYRNATFRGFQIAGDSMLPLVHPGDWVLAKAVSSINDIKDHHVYVIIEAESIRLKKVERSKDGHNLALVSTNTEYPPVSVNTKDVLEIWEYHSKVSIGMKDTSHLTLENIYNEIQDIKKGMG
jgi:phage repressor protein C with HTH and peptisase S24 domain